MYVESRASGKKSWQTGRERVSVLADLALRKETVVRKLVELREAHDLTQERAAAQVGVTVRQWQRWESGQSVPYPRNISAIADHFGIHEGEFFDAPGERQAVAKPPPALEGELADVLQEIKAQLAEQTRVLDEIKAHAASVEQMLFEQRELKAETDEVAEAIRRLGREVVEGRREEAPSPAPVPAPRGGGRKKRAATSRTP